MFACLCQDGGAKLSHKMTDIFVIISLKVKENCTDTAENLVKFTAQFEER